MAISINSCCSAKSKCDEADTTLTTGFHSREKIKRILTANVTQLVDLKKYIFVSINIYFKFDANNLPLTELFKTKWEVIFCV